MAVDIFQMLIEILKISPQLVQEYSAQGPIYQLFYLFFFPMVFIVILVWMVMERFSKHRGLSILIGIAVLAFIILQGWYSFFAYLSRFWILIVVIIAAFMAFFSFRGKKEEGGLARKRIAGVGSQIMGRVYRKAVGIERDLEKEVERAIEAIKSSNTDVSFTEAKGAAEAALMRYREAIDLAGLKGPANRYKEFEEKLQEAIEKQRKKLHIKRIA